MNIQILKDYPSWGGSWSEEDFDSIPEYPDVGALPEFRLRPHPYMAVTRMMGHAMFVYTYHEEQRNSPPFHMWFIPLVAKYWRFERAHYYTARLEIRSECIVDSFQQAVDRVPGIIMMDAL